MGLAPYGEPKYVALIKEKLVDVRDDGSLRMNQEYFGYCDTLRMTNGVFDRLFGGPPREPETKLTQRDLDLARSIQEVTEEAMLKMAAFVHRETGLRRLCLAGGVALNCVGNGRLLREGPFEEIWIQPAAGDAGGSLGDRAGDLAPVPRQAAPQPGVARHLGAGREGVRGRRPIRRRDEGGAPRAQARRSARSRPSWTRSSAPYRKVPREELAEAIADPARRGEGRRPPPGAHGVRPARPRLAEHSRRSRGLPAMQSVMNLKIKFRESFRPFAPSVQREHVADWFELDRDSPYMLLVADVARRRRREMTPAEQALWGIDKLNVVRSEIPAVTHVDYSARVQTVRREANPLYWDILEAFRRKTGCSVVVNTSFNVRGEPIVCTPQDSYRCFRRTEMDALVLENFILRKEDQPPFEETADWRKEFELD